MKARGIGTTQWLFFLANLLSNGADTFEGFKEEVSCTVKLKRHHRKET